ncbi:ABC transporter ATP-binding protein [Sedimentibacter sp. zth1]|uniref:ABC transporter ATP-binding protein n=1 Tax=Sedimentibacter sp. zth1 TaxID=2816908 RepID=UPI001A91D883|nr:ABC transporter ATP-binding protein [Sedimentibacter sp. zth1]QSX05124.1 ABC transporter ATP-binding protein [Sedimentibacter sp. zth1]
MKKKNSGFNLIMPYTKGLKRYFIFAAVAIIIRVFVNFTTPQVIKVTVDSVIKNEPISLPQIFVNMINNIGGVETLRQNLWIPALVIVGLSLITCVCDYTNKVSIAKGSEGLIKKLRNHLYDHIQKLPFSWHSKNQTGDTIQRATQDVELVRRFIASQLAELFRITMLIIIALILMFSMNVKLSLIALVFVPVVALYNGVFYGIISKRFKDADEADGQLYAVAQENLTGVRVVRAFGREKYEVDKFDEKNGAFTDLWIKLGHRLSFYWASGDLFSGLQVLTIIVCGTVEAVHGNITLGEFLAFVYYNSMLVWPIRAFGRVLSEMSKTKVSLKRISEILNEEEEFEDENALTPDFKGKDIEFKNVTFKYSENNSIINDISFKIEAGKTFAILGGTGSGKSTIMHLLSRLYDVEEENGNITIGNINIKDIKLSHLRKNIGMVLQEPFLYSKSIKDNISIQDTKLDINSVKKVANVACVHDAIEGFSNGYDTLVGERGVTLSGGQKQRVAIARMLMQNAPIMVFDDSLSAVDSETDAKIRHALKNNRKDATTILISHRITTLMQADKIMVLDKGKIVDMGTHEELISRDGIYKNIYNVQMNTSDVEI